VTRAAVRVFLVEPQPCTRGNGPGGSITPPGPFVCLGFGFYGAAADGAAATGFARVAGG